ncbi:MAG: phenylalanine--tRNA ligase subunit alpha [Candidatus Pacebacteria bacterium]|nr:phenylalanine--tRNA ligase subunit alpha [Candidatus Paceibacterota bacterium]
MHTTVLYMKDSYLRATSATIAEIGTEGSTTTVVLDQTVMYAQGGGQPSDRGMIRGKNGLLSVSHVSYNGGAIKHLGKLTGELHVGETVEVEVDWNVRYRNMQMHTAGHIVDLAIKHVAPEATAVDGVHGIGKKLHIEYSTLIEPRLLQTIQKETTALIEKNLPIHLEMVTRQQLDEKRIPLPFDLPKNKELRIMSIGDSTPMPDGGTQLHTTGESWPIIVTDIVRNNGHTFVQYTMQEPVKNVLKQKDERAMSESSLNIDDLAQSIEREAQHDVKVLSADQFQTTYLAKKGKLSHLMDELKTVSLEEKKSAGQRANALKHTLEALLLTYDSQKKNSEVIDMTIPGIQPKVGHVHPISQAMHEITRIFEKIGFIRVRYPEVDWEWYPFDSLNMPKDHPARDEWETFLVQSDYVHPILGKMVLTPHTSNGQVREMQRLHSTPPIRMINIARCYRRQADVTHTEMFHQFEGLVVDKGITIQHLKGTIDHFAREFYGPHATSRIRPFHFQFTEPSFEVDFSCSICDGTGKLNGDKCRFCKSGWHEVGGAGMVHPNVLKAGGIDPEQYTGFAFGWGIERTYTLREGLKLDDIRLLYSGDMRFLEQF